MITYNKSLYYFLFVILFSLTALLDSINGFLNKSTGFGSIAGQGTRIIILLIMSFLMIRFHKRNTMPWSYILIFFLVLFQFVYGLVYSSAYMVLSNLLEASKLIYIIVIIQAFINLHAKRQISQNAIEKIIDISLMVFPLCVVVPRFFNVGYYMYDSTSTGFSGFFYAANDLNIVLLVMLIFSLDKQFNRLENKEKSKYYLISSFLLIVSLVLTGAKSSLVVSILILLIYMVRFVLKGKFTTKIKILFLLVASIGTVFIMINSFYYDEMQNIINRHTYFYERDNGNLTTFLLTNRNTFLDASIQSFSDSNSTDKVLQFLFGKGKMKHMEDTGEKLNSVSRPIEMDFFDIFFSYGLLGSILIYCFLTRFLLLAFKKYNLTHHFSYSLSMITFAVYSFLGGHVLFSALSGTYLAMVCCSLYAFKNKNLQVVMRDV